MAVRNVLAAISERGGSMFNFRIIPCADGTEVIDTNLKTPYESLTPSQMVDYVETDKTLAYMDRMERKVRIEEERKRKIARNPIYKMACRLGTVLGKMQE